MTEAEQDTDTAEAKSGGGLFAGIGRHALIYGIGMVAARAVSIVMLPVYTRYLTVADYGVMALVEMTLDFIAIVGGAQLALGVFRFYHKTDDPDAKREVVSTAFALVCCLYVVVGSGVFLSADFLAQLIFDGPEHGGVIRIAALNLIAGSLLIVPLSFARVRDHSTLFVTASLTKLLFAVVFNVLFIVVMGLGVIGIFLGSLVANSVVGLGMTVWLYRKVRARFSLRWTQNLVRYGVPLMAMQVATFLTTFSDRYFLQAAADTAAVGLYNLAYQFGFLMYMVGVTPFEMVWSPKRFELARLPNYDELLLRGFLMMNVVAVTTAVGIVLYAGDALRIMSTPPFHPAAQFVPVILVAYVLQGWAATQETGILVTEKTQYLTAANFLAAAVAVGGYALLVPRYLAWGAAVATVMAFATRYLFTYFFSQRLWYVRYRWRPVWVLVAWAALIASIGLLLPTLPIIYSLAIRTGLVIVYGVGVWLLPVLEGEERDAVRSVAATMIGRVRDRSAA